MIKPLTSLRFFFAFGVFLHHYNIGDGRVIFPEGYLGVNFFFILSGFIISYNYKQKIIERTISKREFIVARIARIYPLHLLTFLIAFAWALRGVVLWPQAFLNLALLQSFIPIREYYYSFNELSWSISNELFFYLMFPVLTVCFMKRKMALAVSLLVICVYFASANIIPEQYHHALFYVHPLARILDFIIGIWLYNVWECMAMPFAKRKILATAIEIFSICILATMIALSKDIPQIYRYASYYWIPISMIILCFALSHKLGGGIISQALSFKPLVIAGEISFGFYMLHDQIMRAVKKIIALPVAFEFLITFTLVLAVSMASFYYFEKPMSKWIKRKFS